MLASALVPSFISRAATLLLESLDVAIIAALSVLMAELSSIMAVLLYSEPSSVGVVLAVLLEQAARARRETDMATRSFLCICKKEKEIKRRLL